MKDLALIAVATLLLISIISILFQITMNYISGKINYKLDKKHYIVSIILNPICTLMLLSRYGVNLMTFIIIIIVTIVISSCMIDWKYQELPDSYNLAIALLGVIVLTLLVTVYGLSIKEILPNVISSIGLFGGFFLLAVISGGAIGGGDIKLMGAIGLLFHYSLIPRILMYSFMPGAVFALLLMLLGKMKKEDKFAFGPFLALGSILTLII